MTEAQPTKAYLVTPEVRLSFPYLFQPRPPMAGSTGGPKYGAMLIFDKAAQNTPEFKALLVAVVNAATEKWGADKTKWPVALRTLGTPAKGNPFRRGSEPRDKPLEGIEPDSVFINASSTYQPQVVGRQRDGKGVLIPIVEPRLAYAGCYVRAYINAFAYDTAGNRGVSFGLNAIQVLRDGTTLGNRARADEVFKPLADDPPPGSAAEAGTTGTGADAAGVDALFG